jgi:transposase-like protein
MAEDRRMTAEEVVNDLLQTEHADVVRESVRWMVQQMMEVEVSGLIGAEHGERTEDRATHRNGYRPRRFDTRAGELEIAIPKLRKGSYFPSFLQPRKRAEQALVAVVQEAYVAGVSTRKVDQVVESLGLRVSKSEVSRICAGLDEQVEAFRSRPLEGRYPYLFLDAKVEKVRDGGRVVRKCVVMAHGVHETGRREVIGLDVGEAETEAFWREFLRGLVARGLIGVQLVVSDAHPGLKAAIARVLSCPWQRCTVHFLRDCLGQARKEHGPMLAALIRPIFAAPSREQAGELLGQAVVGLEPRLPKVARMLTESEGGHPRVLRLPRRPPPPAALHQPARAPEPRGRPAHRRGGDLPQRPGPDPSRDLRGHRAERRVAGGPALLLRGVDGAAPRGAAPSPRGRGGGRTAGGVRSCPYRRSPTPRPGTCPTAAMQAAA